jgi:hypothetical protein
MPDPFLNWLRRWGWTLLAAAGVGSAAVLFFFDPSRHGFYPLCMFHRLTGWDCPGCGGLRATHQLLHGHLGEALRLNALVVLAVPVLMALAWRWLWVRVRGRRVPPKPLATLWIWLLLAVMLGFGLARNLPFLLGAQPSP